MSIFSNVGSLKGALNDVGSLGSFGTYTHAGLLDIANSSYGGAVLGSAAAGGLINGINVGLNDANWPHKGFYAPVSGMLTGANLIGYKWDVEPPISKTNLQTLRYQFEISWDRYEPT